MNDNKCTIDLGIIKNCPEVPVWKIYLQQKLKNFLWQQERNEEPIRGFTGTFQQLYKYIDITELKFDEFVSGIKSDKAFVFKEAYRYSSKIIVYDFYISMYEDKYNTVLDQETGEYLKRSND